MLSACRPEAPRASGRTSSTKSQPHTSCVPVPLCPAPRVAVEGKGPRRRRQNRLDRRLEEASKAVRGGYCRLQMPLSWHLASGRQWLGIGWAPGREGGLPLTPPPPHCIPARTGNWVPLCLCHVNEGPTSACNPPNRLRNAAAGQMRGMGAEGAGPPCRSPFYCADVRRFDGTWAGDARCGAAHRRSPMAGAGD